MSDVYNPLTPMSYTNKDFRSIYEELIDTVKKLTYKWDPSISNESDPGVILLKLNAIIGDKNNYNIDKNILEAFPETATQEISTRDLYRQLGYKMQWYNSATTNIHISWRGRELVNGEYITIPKNTMFCDPNANIVYTTIQDATIYASLKGVNEVNIPAIQGVLTEYNFAGNPNITINNIDDRNRLYLNDTNIAQNGIFLTNIEDANNNLWEIVDNIGLYPNKSKVFELCVDSRTGATYLQFPEDIEYLIKGGLRLSYLISDGLKGNVSAKFISQFYQEDTLAIMPTQEKITSSIDNFIVYNSESSVDGNDPETIREAFNSYKKVSGTFDTIVTLRDYMNVLFESGLVNNSLVTDRNNDPQCSYTIIDRNSDTLFEDFIQKTKSDKTIRYLKYQKVENSVPNFADKKVFKFSKDTNTMHEVKTEPAYWSEEYSNYYILDDGADDIEAFDLKMYLLKYTGTPTTVDSYDEGFEVDDSLQTSVSVKGYIDELKSIEHNFAKIQNYDSSDMQRINPFLFRNVYPIAIKVIPTYKLSDIQVNEVSNNIRLQLMKLINSHQVEFGVEPNYDEIYTCIKEADSRIKVIILDDFVYTTFATYFDSVSQDGNEEKIFKSIPISNYEDCPKIKLFPRRSSKDISIDGILDQAESIADKEKNPQNYLYVDRINGILYTYNRKEKKLEEYSRELNNIRKIIIAKNILAGVTPLYKKDTSFDFTLAMQEIPSMTKDVENITTELEIHPFGKDSERNENDNVATYTLPENECLQLLAPMFRTKKSFSNYVKFEVALKSPLGSGAYVSANPLKERDIMQDFGTSDISTIPFYTLSNEAYNKYQQIYSYKYMKLKGEVPYYPLIGMRGEKWNLEDYKLEKYNVSTDNFKNWTWKANYNLGINCGFELKNKTYPGIIKNSFNDSSAFYINLPEKFYTSGTPSQPRDAVYAVVDSSNVCIFTGFLDDKNNELGNIVEIDEVNSEIYLKIKSNDIIDKDTFLFDPQHIDSSCLYTSEKPMFHDPGTYFKVDLAPTINYPIVSSENIDGKTHFSVKSYDSVSFVKMDKEELYLPIFKSSDKDKALESTGLNYYACDDNGTIKIYDYVNTVIKELNWNKYYNQMYTTTSELPVFTSSHDFTLITPLDSEKYFKDKPLFLKLKKYGSEWYIPMTHKQYKDITGAYEEHVGFNKSGVKEPRFVVINKSEEFKNSEEFKKYRYFIEVSPQNGHHFELPSLENNTLIRQYYEVPNVFDDKMLYSNGYAPYSCKIAGNSAQDMHKLFDFSNVNTSNIKTFNAFFEDYYYMLSDIEITEDFERVEQTVKQPIDTELVGRECIVPIFNTNSWTYQASLKHIESRDNEMHTGSMQEIFENLLNMYPGNVQDKPYTNYYFDEYIAPKYFDLIHTVDIPASSAQLQSKVDNSEETGYIFDLINYPIWDINPLSKALDKNMIALYKYYINTRHGFNNHKTEYVSNSSEPSLITDGSTELYKISEKKVTPILDKDWKDTYLDYFVPVFSDYNISYKSPSKSAPLFESMKYYKQDKEDSSYSVLVNQPADWEKSYGEYAVRSSSKVAGLQLNSPEYTEWKAGNLQLFTKENTFKIPANTEYQLREGDYLVVFYREGEDEDTPYTYEYFEGTKNPADSPILRVNFQLNASRLGNVKVTPEKGGFAETGTIPYSESESSTFQQIAKLYGQNDLAGSRQIEIREIDKVDLTSEHSYYFITRDKSDDEFRLTLKPLEETSKYRIYSYTLQEDEYFLVTDNEYSNYDMRSSGSLIKFKVNIDNGKIVQSNGDKVEDTTIFSDTRILLTNKIVDTYRINLDGVKVFKEYVTAVESNEDIQLIEQQVYSFVEGDTVNFLLNDEYDDYQTFEQFTSETNVNGNILKSPAESLLELIPSKLNGGIFTSTLDDKYHIITPVYIYKVDADELPFDSLEDDMSTEDKDESVLHISIDDTFYYKYYIQDEYERFYAITADNIDLYRDYDYVFKLYSSPRIIISEPENWQTESDKYYVYTHGTTTRNIKETDEHGNALLDENGEEKYISTTIREGYLKQVTLSKIPNDYPYFSSEARDLKGITLSYSSDGSTMTNLDGIQVQDNDIGWSATAYLNISSDMVTPQKIENNEQYSPVVGIVPDFYDENSRGIYILKMSGTKGHQYIKLGSEPYDWEENYQSYYRVKDGIEEPISAPEFYTNSDNFEKVKSKAPTWQRDTYYSYDISAYTLQSNPPDDWSTNFSDYFTKKVFSVESIEINGVRYPDDTGNSDFKSNHPLYLLTSMITDKLGGKDVDVTYIDGLGETHALDVFAYQINPTFIENKYWEYTSTDKLVLNLNKVGEVDESDKTINVVIPNIKLESDKFYILPMDIQASGISVEVYALEMQDDKPSKRLKLEELGNRDIDKLPFTKGKHFLHLPTQFAASESIGKSPLATYLDDTISFRVDGIAIVIKVDDVSRFNSSSIKDDNGKIVFGHLFKYERENTFEEDYGISLYDIEECIKNLDIHNKFNYTYQPASNKRIDDPLIASTFFNNNHVFNDFTIPHGELRFADYTGSGLVMVNNK